MKRFALKRITALVLALIMTLSLLPMNVWAETQVFEGSTSRGAAGVFLFTELDETGEILTCSENVRQDGRTITVPCVPTAPEVVYLAVNEHEGLKVGETLQTNPVGTWQTPATDEKGNEFTMTCNVYKLPVPKETATYTIVRSDVGGTEDRESFSLVFDFTPVFTDSGKYDAVGMYIFTGLTNGDNSESTVLSCNPNVINHQWHDYGKRIDVTINCYPTAPETVYFAVVEGETLPEFAATKIGKWNTDGRRYDVYSVAVPTSGKTTEYAGVWTMDNGARKVAFNLTFDFTRVFDVEGDVFNPYDVYIFTGEKDDTLTYNGAAKRWGDEIGEHVTVYCMPEEKEKTVYLAVADRNTLELDGIEPVGKWNKPESNDQGNSWKDTYNVYALTVQKPQNGTVADLAAKVIYNDGGVNPFTYHFDFENYPTQLWAMQWDSWTNEGISIDWGTIRNVKLSVGTPIAKTALTKTNCTKIETVGNIGTIDWSDDGTEILLDTSTASDQKGSIKVTYNGESYTLGVELNYWCLFWDNGGDYDRYKDIISGFVYDWELYAEMWSDESQGWIYPKINSNEYDLLAYDSVGTDRTSCFSWNNDGSVHFDARALKQENFPIVLIAKAKEGGCYYHLEISEMYLSDQDQSCWKTYTTNVVTEGDYTYGGYSTLTVQLTPEQAQFITLPEKLTANNELVITVHDPGEAGWREQVGLGFEGLAVFYQYDVKRGIEDGEIPRVKQVGGPWSAPDFFEVLYKPEYPIEDYFDGRGNGNIFGKVFYETDKIIVIPEEEEIRSAWIWMYDDGTQLADSVNVKLVFDDDIGGAVTLDNEQLYPAVDISHVTVQETGLEEVLDFKKNGESLSYENGTLTYCYTGPTSIEELENAFVTTVADHVVRSEAQEDDYLGYNLLTVTAPDGGYKLKTLNGRTEQAGESSVRIWYEWEGLAIERTYTLVWVNGAGKEYVEQITIDTPAVDNTEWWMDHLYNGAVRLVDADRMLVTPFDKDSGAEHKRSDGFAFVQFDNEAELDVNTIKDATIRIQAPKNNNDKLPVAYRYIWLEDASNDEPFYNTRMNGWIEKIEGQVESIDPEALGKNNATTELDLNALLKQTIGDIEYYYSGDRGTRIIVVKWIYDLKAENDGAVYEYLRLDTSPYYCTVEAKVSTDVNGAVDKPTAEVDESATGHSNIYLETRIHPQEEKGGKYGQYFFELRLVDGTGNTYVEYHKDGYTIILPYSFMGEDWNYAKAQTLKEKPIINHYDKNFNLKKDNGAIKGEYTERGIEFKVGDFSPFMLTWDETVKDNTGGTPGGYYPIVTPTTPVEKPTETKPTTPAQPTTPPAEVTVPVSGDENTINVETSVSGSTATIDKVDMTKLEGVIGDDVAVGTVTIDFSDLKSSEVIDTVEIPADVVKEIAEAVADPNNDAESLEIVLSDGASIEFDATALAEKVSQAGGADITISIKQAVENVLSAAQQAAVGDRVAFDINVTSGGVHISDMGSKITIHAPYELRDGETAEGIVVYYVDDAGNKEKCETSYDSVKKRVNWKTDHLSVYMIAHEAPTTDDAPAVDNTPADDMTPSDSGNSVGLWIGVALAVLVVAIIVVVILIKRKKA